MRYGRCTNFDLPCPKYVSEEIIDVAEGADFVCPECGRDLVTAKSKGQLPWKKIAAGAAILLLVSGGAYGVYAWTSSEPGAEREQIVHKEATTELHREGIMDFEPPEDWPEPKRELVPYLVLGTDLPVGKIYREETGQAAQEREAALSAFEQQWNAVQQDVASYKSTALGNLPAACTKDTAPLIKEITRKGTDECPKIRDKAERDACYLDVQRLNSELGACETRNQVRKEAQRQALANVATFEQEQVAALGEKLKAQAARHDNQFALSK